MTTNHEVTISDLYSLMMIVKDDVTKMSSNSEALSDKIVDHEARIRELDRSSTDAIARHQLNSNSINSLKEDLKTSKQESKDLSVQLEDVKKKVYQYAGAAAILGAISAPIINSVIGK